MTGATTLREARALTPRPDRVPYWDTARFVCVTLVVVGHAIQRQVADSDGALALYLGIYAFHMPALALISGYFTSADPPDAPRMRRVITDLVIPYLVLQAVWSLVQWAVEGDPGLDPSRPHWTLWFLIALALWRVGLPYLALLRHPLLWALAASVIVGYLPQVDSTFALSRTIAVLPFFVLGWRLRNTGAVDRWLGAGSRVWMVRGVAVAVLATWTAVLVAGIDWFREVDLRLWFFYDDGYAALGEPGWWAGLVRLALIGLALLLTAAVLALVPRRETVVTALGQATMYVYLLHSFVLYPIRESGFLGDGRSSPTWVVAMVVASVAIAILLASPPVRRLFRPLVEPRPRRLFRDPGPPAAPPHPGARHDAG